MPGLKIRRLVAWFEEGPHKGRYVVAFGEPKGAADVARVLETTEDWREARQFETPEDVQAFWVQEAGLGPGGEPWRPLMRWTISWKTVSYLRPDCADCGGEIRWAVDPETESVAPFETAGDGGYEIQEEDHRYYARERESGGYRPHRC